MHVSHLPVVAVLGRPNVGKSTFFNRVIGRRVAIVDDQPGVTRDRNFARAEWAGRRFFIVDTGGVVVDSDEPLERAIRDQALAAVEEADVILLLVDGQAGRHPLDERLGDLLRKADKPVLLVVNKVDNLPDDTPVHDFWALGLGTPLPVSAISGKGSGDLLDALVGALPEAPESADEEAVRVAVIGKPNVGKSSFINRLFGAERVVVSEKAGTTRDPVDTPMQYHGRTLVFVDTAGLRRHSRVKDSVEYYSALRTARVVQDADVCLALVDATEPLHVQDLKVLEQAWEAGAGVILLVNKWDLVEDKDTHTAPAFERHVRERAPFLRWVPVVFTSALTGQRVRKTLDLVLQVEAERRRRIDTAQVNDALREIVARQPPPHHRGHPVKLRYGTQVQVAPPTFVIFANFPKAVPAHYIRYVHNGFRERWGFEGTPIRIRIRASKRKEY